MHLITWTVLVLFILKFACATSVTSDSTTQGPRQGLGFFEPLDYDRLQFFAPVSTSVENQLCRSHSLHYLTAVGEHQLWALKMLDASTKAAEGKWVGSLVQLGNYDECLSVQRVPSSGGTFSGQHCLMSLGASSLFSEINQSKKENETHMLNITKRLEGVAAGGVRALVSKMGATVAMCIPSSCTSHDLERHLRSELRSSDISVRVDELSCSSDNDKTVLQTNDWCAIALLTCLGALIFASTTYDLTRKKTGSDDCLMTTFSAYSNGRKLLKVTSPTADYMTSLSGIRTLGIIWVVIVHTSVLAIITPRVNVTLQESAMYEFRNLYLTHSTVMLETMFVLSGLLVCYNFLRDREKGIDFNLFKFYIHRYIRLTPPYAVMMLLVATLANYTGDGPWWKANMAASRHACERYWMFGLLYVNNYYPGEGMCMGSMGETWYLAVDMQLFLLSPLILYPLWRYPNLGKTLWGVSVAAGLTIACAVPYVNEFPLTMFPGFSVSAYHQYYVTHTRFTPWLLGMGLGYLLHTTRNKPLTLSRPVVVGGWVLAMLLMNASFLPAYYFYQSDYVYERVSASLFTGLSRFGIALGVAWIVFACVRGYGGKLNSFLSSAPMQVLGRLSYTVYLSHMTVLRHFYASVRTPIYFDEFSLLMTSVGKLTLCFGVATVLHLVVEAPVLNRNYFSKLKVT